MKNIFFLLLFIGCINQSCTEPTNQVIDSKEVIAKTVNAVAESTERIPFKPAITFDSTITTDYIMGKFNPAKHPNFVKIAPKHANRNDRLLRKEAYADFIKMYEAAKKDGITLKIISATRNFATQKIIWEGKWTGKRLHESKENLAKTTPDPTERAIKILRWSSMPGTSRHHWGTDIDLNNLTNSFFEKGEGLKIYTWLTANAATYGFCQPYSPKGAERPDGYNEEKWHWSYLPIAKKLTQQARIRLKNDMISGFKGSETAISIGVVDKFILGINEDCL